MEGRFIVTNKDRTKFIQTEAYVGPYISNHSYNEFATPENAKDAWDSLSDEKAKAEVNKICRIEFVQIGDGLIAPTNEEKYLNKKVEIYKTKKIGTVNRIYPEGVLDSEAIFEVLLEPQLKGQYKKSEIRLLNE